MNKWKGEYMKPIYYLVLFILILASCSPNPPVSAVQTAIAQTQKAQPITNIPAIQPSVTILLATPSFSPTIAQQNETILTSTPIPSVATTTSTPFVPTQITGLYLGDTTQKDSYALAALRLLIQRCQVGIMTSRLVKK